MHDMYDYIIKNSRSEYNELIALLEMYNIGTRKSRLINSRISELILTLKWNYEMSRFSDYKTLDIVGSNTPHKDSYLDKFKKETRYGCGLWIGDIINKEGVI